MAQHDYVIANGTGAAVRSDINNGLAAIVSNNSGATEPATMYAYQWWADTTTGLLKIRNAANNGWVTVGTLASANLGLLASAGTLTAALGSASTPGITFTGDTNTGIYSPGADQVAVATSGTGRLFVDSSGRVGLGTSAPKEVIDSRGALVISGDNATSTNAFGTAEGVLLSTGTGVGRITAISNGNNNVDLSLRALNAGTATEGIRIKNDGKVGIGTTAPTKTLTVGSASTANTTVRLNCSTTAGSDTGMYSFGVDDTADFAGLKFDYSDRVAQGLQIFTASGYSFPISFSTNGSQNMTLDGSGRLLIGTSTATNNLRLDEKFAIVGTTANYPGMAITGYTGGAGGTDYSPLIELKRSRGTTDGSFTKVESGDALGKIMFLGADGSSWAGGAYIEAFVDGATSAGDLPTRLVFSTTADGASSPTERMRISHYGRFDMRTDTAAFGGSGIPTLGLWSSGTTASTQYLIYGAHSSGSAYSGTNCFQVINNGNVLNTNNSYGSLSDIKLKENIVDAGSQWDDLKGLQVRKYNFKAETNQQTHTQIGLIAQEVELVSPGLVSESPDRDEDGNDLGTVTKSVNYSVLYMKAVKALQEAMERIEVLEQRLADAGIA
jgi:hypothetical protein